MSSTATWSRSASKARSRTGSPLRSTAWPTKARRSGAPGGRGASAGQLGRHVDAVGDDPVAAAVEAPAGPRGGLGDGDAHVQALELALGAEGVADRVGDDVLGVAVEGADERRERRVERVVAHDRSDRLVHVDDVEAARRAARGAAS